MPSKYVDPSGEQIFPGYPPSFPIRNPFPTPPSPPKQPAPPSSPSYPELVIKGLKNTNYFPGFVSCSVFPCGANNCFFCLMLCGSDYPHSTGLYQLYGLPCRLGGPIPCDQFDNIHIKIGSPSGVPQLPGMPMHS